MNVSAVCRFGEEEEKENKFEDYKNNRDKERRAEDLLMVLQRVSKLANTNTRLNYEQTFPSPTPTSCKLLGESEY